MRHALDADHVAAVATLVSRSVSVGHAVKLGALWGLGHTVTLLVLGAIVIGTGGSLPGGFSRWAEIAIGAILIALGADVLRRLARERIHVHLHRHRDGRVHVHAHAHARGTRAHAHPDDHEHGHPRGFAWRALLVGLTHGAAGTAALTLLVLETIRSPWLGVVYIGLFGLGSILGMAVLSLAVAVPLRHSARHHVGLHYAMQAGIAIASIAIGSVALSGMT